MSFLRVIPFLLLAYPAGSLAAQGEAKPGTESKFDAAAASMVADLKSKNEELSALQGAIAQEKLPLTRTLNDLESKLAKARAEYQKKKIRVDSSGLIVANLKKDIKDLKAEADFVRNLFGDYTREFESGIHIAERQRYEDKLKAAKDAIESGSSQDVGAFASQASLVAATIERLHEGLGGARFKGHAMNAAGEVAEGQFLMLGHHVLFRSEDGAVVGSAESRMNSLEPVVRPFPTPENTARAGEVVAAGAGMLPFDATGGSAFEMAAVEDSLMDEFRKGGTVMYPILGMAAVALILAIYKWLSMAFIGRPSRKQVSVLLDAVAHKDQAAARRNAESMRDPVREMLVSGVQNIEEPRELMEEAMYESVLKTRLKLNSLLPFIAICAASAPLLGLLGTVTGIINTFKLIEIYGSGDVKTLSGGISEALLTTKYGLVVAIPSLLLHAYLSRKARGVVGNMETIAVSFVNQVVKSYGSATRPQAEVVVASGSGAANASLVRAQVSDILREILGPMERGGLDGGSPLGASPNSPA